MCIKTCTQNLYTNITHTHPEDNPEISLILHGQTLHSTPKVWEPANSVLVQHHIKGMIIYVVIINAHTVKSNLVLGYVPS